MTMIIANWKMYFTLQNASYFCKALTKIKQQNQLIIATAVPYLAYLASNYPELKFAAQNISRFEDFGPYTGEYSAQMIKSCNVNYAILGHSERREIFLDNDQLINIKIENALKAGIIPIICIGERNKSANNISQDLKIQLLNVLEVLRNFNQEVVIAYEPRFAIGTGLTPTLNDLQNIFSFIKLMICKSNLVDQVKLVYGGSVNLGNIASILKVAYVDGVLIGNYSMNQQNLIELIEKEY